jgi:hypothetical protein
MVFGLFTPLSGTHEPKFPENSQRSAKARFHRGKLGEMIRGIVVFLDLACNSAKAYA